MSQCVGGKAGRRICTHIRSESRWAPSAARAIIAIAAAVLCSQPTYAQSAANVAVVINDTSPDSQRIGDYYVRRRGVPPANVVHLKTSVEETIERATYLNSIESPILAALTERFLQDRILYIVLTKGIPLRILGDN